MFTPFMLSLFQKQEHLFQKAKRKADATDGGTKQTNWKQNN
jgi:hypothetical protein